jgi:hypothetical protein
MNLKKWTGFANNALWVINPFLLLIAFFNEKLKLGIYLEWFGKMHPLFLHFPIVLGILIGIYYLVDKKGSVENNKLHPILVGNAFLASIVAIQVSFYPNKIVMMIHYFLRINGVVLQ